MRGAGVLASVGTLTAAALVLAAGWRASTRAMHPSPPSFAWSLDDYPALKAQAKPFSFRSSTGGTLVGRYVPGATQALVVLTHGYGGGWEELLPVAGALHEAGLGVALYDLRGRGASDGEVTFGARERDDLRAAVSHLSSLPGVDPERVGAFGFSMGGAATIMAAAEDPRIKAVVADSAWAEADHWLRPSVSAALLHPRDPFTALSLKLVELRAGVDVRGQRPVEQIERLSPRPLLLIHPVNDDVVPVADAHANYAAAHEPKELWVVDETGHGETLVDGGAAASSRVARFFRAALAVPK